MWSCVRPLLLALSCTWPLVFFGGGEFFFSPRRLAGARERTLRRLFVSAPGKIITNATQELLEAMFLSGCLHPLQHGYVTLTSIMPHLDSTLLLRLPLFFFFSFFFFLLLKLSHTSARNKNPQLKLFRCLKNTATECLTRTEKRHNGSRVV